MKFWGLNIRRKAIVNQVIIGLIIGLLFALIEYFSKINTNDFQAFLPLIIRASFSGVLIVVSIFLSEQVLKQKLRKKSFIVNVISRSITYAITTTFWLACINSVWFVIEFENFNEQLINYFVGESYLLNMAYITLVLIPTVGLIQIDSLHRKGELLNFILGRYHKPKELNLIFCFIDLTGSTSITEELGNYKYALFLKDFYSDISPAIENTSAEVIDFIGDEIVLSWSFRNGLRENNMINCFFQMHEIIESKKEKYLRDYGVYPKFRAGLHGGAVVVTWVGEVKKEIVYIGDVLNTTSRIQEDCKRLNADFLISEDLLEKTNNLENIKASFVEEVLLRGKSKEMKLFSLEKI